MRTLFTFVALIALPLFLNAQKTVIWRGGAPGQETDWTVGKNWSTNHMPWTDDIVIIPNLDTQGRSYPVINSRVPRIGAMVIHDKAKLILTDDAILEIDGSWNNTYGIHLVGSIKNKGLIRISNTGLDPLFVQGFAQSEFGDLMIEYNDVENDLIAEKQELN